MAKKDTVFIDIQTSDGGSMQRVAVSAKKLGLALDDVGKGQAKAGKSARDADRNLKGLSQQSANGTKNFSKMAQGMTGTLVPAYAILASNVFAITAAFQFLKQAADFRVMQDSQVAFTAATGVGMQSLTKNIQEASGMMLEFQAASEAASIGIASGLGSGQIEELAAGAGNLSKILGRDVTDSFNRLVRGVTKAEPELLDELGITLRLADAQENYAAKLNKSAKDLTNFEKKQAVFAEVQDQLETKYGKVAKATDVQVNAVSRLGIEFDRVMKGIKAFTAAIAEPTAKFLTENILGLGAALALLAVPIVKAIIPGLDNWAEKSRESADEAGKAYKAAQQDIKDLENQQEKLERSLGGRGAAKAAGKAKKGTGLDMLQTGNEATLKKDKRRIAQMLRHAEAGNGAIKSMNKRQAKDYIATLKGMQRGHNTFTERVGMNFRRMTAGASLSMKKMKVEWAATMATMKGAAAKFSSGVDKIFRAAGWIGILVLAGELGMEFAKMLGFFKENEGLKNLAQNFEDIAENLVTVNSEYSEFAKVQKEIARSGGTAFDAIIAQGNFFSNVTGSITAAVQALRDFEDGTTSAQIAQGKLAEQAAERAKEIVKLEKAEKRGSKRFDSGVTFIGRGVEDALNIGANFFQGVDRDAFSEAQEKQLANLRELEAEYQSYEGDLEGAQIAEQKVAAAVLANTTAVTGYLESLDKRSPMQQQYLDGLNAVREAAEKGKAPTQKQIDDIDTLGKKFEEAGRLAQHLKTQQKELEKQFQQAVNGITQYSTSVSSLQKLTNDQITSLNNLIKKAQDPAAEKQAKEEIKLLDARLKILDKIADAEARIQNLKIVDQTVFNAALQGATTLQKEQLALAKKRLDNTREIQKLNVLIENAEKISKDTNVEKVDQMRLQVDSLVRQNELLREQEETVFQIMTAGKQAFETGMQGAISKLLKGEESSLKDALLGIGKGVVDSMIDALAKDLTKDFMGLFGMETDEQKQAKAIAEGHLLGSHELKTAHTEGAEKFRVVLDDFGTRFAETIRGTFPKDTTLDGTPLDSTTDGPPGALTPDQIRSAMANPGTLASSYAADGTGEGTAGTISAAATVALDDTTVAKLGGDPNSMAGVLDGTMQGALGGFHGQDKKGKGKDEQAEATKENSSIMDKLTSETAKNVVQLGFAATALLGNSKAGQKLQKVMAALTLIQQARFIWEKVSKVKEFILDRINNLSTSANTAALVANTAVQATSGGGGFFSKILGFFGGGGARSGLYPPRGYATGGIARGSQAGYPTLLHGTEAVVPLPDGKSIPVTMPRGRGGLGETNNVSVTVNMTSDGQASTETETNSRDTAAFGERLAELVQEELMNQKRAGGILSPYGAA